MKLPREWFTIQQVVERWRADGIDCCEDDVLHLVETFHIYYSFYLSNVSSILVTKDSTAQVAQIRSGLVTPPITTPDYYQKLMSILNGGCDFDKVKLIYGAPNLNYKDESELTLLVPIGPTLVTIADLRISNGELHRYKQKNDMVDKSSSNEDAVTEPPKESTRVISNLQKALVAIAIDAYGYDPTSKSSTTVQDILSALDAVGVSLSANTIREHLKTGAQMIDQGKA